MFEMNYKPKYFNSYTTEIKRINNKTVFIFKDTFGRNNEIKVDETVDRIKSRMQDVINGEREMVYLTNGMMNVDIRLLDNGKWQLFDEFDVYEFEMPKE